MTLAPSAPAQTLSTLVGTFTELLDEALHGPACSGRTETLTVDGVDLEVAASHGWGVRISRTLPNGTTASRHLSGSDLTLHGVDRAVENLLGRL